jgi:hypothetical protein
MMSDQTANKGSMNRCVIVRQPVAAAPGTPHLHLLTPHQVSPLDLPPALVYRVEDQDVSGLTSVQWITDPVALSRYCHHHPLASVTVMGTERISHRH